MFFPFYHTTRVWHQDRVISNEKKKKKNSKHLIDENHCCSIFSLSSHNYVTLFNRITSYPLIIYIYIYIYVYIYLYILKLRQDIWTQDLSHWKVLKAIHNFKFQFDSIIKFLFSHYFLTTIYTHIYIYMYIYVCVNI